VANRILRILIILMLPALLTGCARPPELVGVDNPVFPVQAQRSVSLRRVYIATTREATDVTGAFYSAERAPELALASVVVSIPPDHVSGAIERPQRLPPDPRTEFAIIEPTTYGSDDAFVRQLNRELAALPPQDREILFFVHGYNNTISDSILRLAQFVEDTEFGGIPVLFSWASAARATYYVYDINSALIARPKLLQASAILERVNASGFNIFAHSMGSFLTLEAIVQNSLLGKYGSGARLKNVMLAAPDIDMDLFRSQLVQIGDRPKDFFVFVSSDDKALRLSRRLSGGIERVGAADGSELEELGVTVIDLSAVQDSQSGSHSKFAGSPEVVQLIGSSLKEAHFDQPRQLPTLVEVLDGVPILNVLTN